MKILVINCSPVKNGATAEIVKIISEELSSRHCVKAICIDDYKINFCRGCRKCHETARCTINDDYIFAAKEFENADVIISCSPSYWAEVPGQWKSFIDRWTPWCNTHEPHAKLKSGKKGFSIVQRTGPGIKECEKIVQTIEHFYGHLEIECAGHLCFTSIENKNDVLKHRNEIIGFCSSI